MAPLVAMTDPNLALLLVVFLAAGIYASVGQGGASGYLAAMALFGLSAATMKPSALVMNIAVVTWVWWRFAHGGYFRPRLFLPLAATAVPMAALGGGWLPSSPSYHLIIGGVLLAAAAAMFLRTAETSISGTPSVTALGAVGAAIGLISGATGIGGGIFLAPLVLLLGWADMRTTAALCAAFIWVNSAAALAGFVIAGHSVPGDITALVLVAVAGAVPGTELGIRGLSPMRLRGILGGVLVVAGSHLLLNGPASPV